MLIPGRDQSALQVNIFDGARQLLPPGRASVLYRIIDGNQRQLLLKEYSEPSKTFSLPFYDNFGDNYTITVSANGYVQSGYTPVKLSPSRPTELDLMLLPKRATFDFSLASWESIKAALPFLAQGADDSAAGQRYAELLAKKPKCLAALLNITTAMSQIFLRAGTPLDYLKAMKWDETLAQDRFFAYCDPSLIDQVRFAAERGLFVPEFGCSFFHKGASLSWKQVQFDQGNVQLTFHESDRKTVDGLDCIVVEPDIDYYKDQGAHAFCEVLPNSITGGLTDPEIVYVLRWIAGRHAGVPDFNPPYKIVG